MIDGLSLIYVDNTADVDGNSVIEFNHLERCDIEEYDIYDEKDFKKYVKDIEYTVRGSFEYQRAIRFLKDYMDMKQCAFLQHVTGKEEHKMHIEVHHTPFTLFDITLIVIAKRRSYHEDMDVTMVAKEICELHYKLMVGLIPLSKTVHELVHNQYLFIPINNVYGKLNLFIDTYWEFIPEDLKDTYKRNMDDTLTFMNEMNNANVLMQNNIRLNTKSIYSLPDFQQLDKMLGNRIDTIKSNAYMLPNMNPNAQSIYDKQEPIQCITFEYGENYVAPY